MVSVQYQVAGRSTKEISDSLESGIRHEDLDPGRLLPSVRALAGQLHVAPGTVAAAYRVLRDRGLVETQGRNGTRVRSRPGFAARSNIQPLGPGVVDLASGQPDPGLLPRLDDLPGLPNGPASAPPELLLSELLEAGRNRFAADGVPTESVTLSSGGLDAIGRVLSTQLRSGDTVAVEDPGWPNALDLIGAMGLRPHPVAVDAEGPQPQSLKAALRAGARAVIITNRAQNPTGAFLSRMRASELRDLLARHPQTVVIEDDHAAELAGVDLASVAGTTESWAFIRSTSKPWGPDLRVGLIAGDEATIARVDGRIRTGSGWVSTLLQRVVLQLWNDPRATASVAQAALTYDARRQQLISNLAERGVQGMGETGLNVWVPVSDETATVTSLLQAGWGVAPGARFRQISSPGVRVTVSCLTEATIPSLADDIANAVIAGPSRHYTT